MADSKSRYSAAAKHYARVMSHGSMLDAVRYARSKAREAQFNENWKRNSVDLNEIVERFTPGAKGKPHGVKFEFKNDKYIVKVDMPSGYLRILDRKTKKYLRLDGTPSDSREETHFKVKKRREMKR